MRSYEEIERDARDGRAFSNGTSWEIWQFNVCMGADNPGRRCVNDDSLDENGGCPLILLALSQDKTPREWTGPLERYRCTEKTTAVDVRRAARLEREAAEKAALEAEHYSMFEPPEVSS